MTTAPLEELNGVDSGDILGDAEGEDDELLTIASAITAKSEPCEVPNERVADPRALEVN